MTMKSDEVWAKLATGDGKRVRENGRFDFFWAILEGGSPALVLFLPTFPKNIEQLPRLRNIEAGFRVLSKPAFYLKLMDGAQKELFYVLCQDVVEAAEGADSLEKAMERAIHRTRRWHFLLKAGNMRGLSLEEQRGLVGELAFLREICDAVGPAAAIEAWNGPEGSSKDFEFPECCVEIKARRSAAKPHVSISSVDQLSDVEGANVYLRVYNVDSAADAEGDSLHDHVARTAGLFELSDLIFEKWQNRIYSTGYAPEGDYANPVWVVGALNTFEISEGFPRLGPHLPAGVENLTYSISLEACEPFRVDNSVAVIAVRGDLNGRN